MHTFLKTPIGLLKISSDKQGMFLLSVKKANSSKISFKKSNSILLRQASQQLKEYFQGRRKKFNLPLHKKGTLFQKQVWKELQNICYGNTLSYLKVAHNIKKTRAQRAVGSACNKNPFLIIIPCHRVLKSDQSLGGFAVGIKAKKWLLEHEK